MSVTSSQAQNISSPSGNSLAVFVDGVTGILTLKDINGKTEPLSNYLGEKTPFRYNSNGTGIEPILGGNNSNGNYATIGGGSCNATSGYCNTISGGYNNVASYNRSTIGGGAYNISSGQQTTVSGGLYNSATCQGGFIGGGRCNNSTEAYGTISGGYMNSAVASYATVSGGYCNFADGQFSSILGGRNNDTKGFCNTHIIGSYICASQSDTTFTNCVSAQNLTAGCFVQVGLNGVLINSPAVPVAGSIMILGAGVGSTYRCGLSNNAQGNYSTVSGGSNNSSNGLNGTISGGFKNCQIGSYSTIGGGCCNYTGGNSIVVAGGCFNKTYSDYSVISGGRRNCIVLGGGYSYSIIGGGSYNCVSGSQSIISGGYCNIVTESCSNVSGGKYNNVSNGFSSISGGISNTVSGKYSNIAGGACNIASGAYMSSIGGGFSNIASCWYTTIGGGYQNEATVFNAVVGGGAFNCSNGNSNVIGGGCQNSTSNFHSTVSGGKLNTASGLNSTVSGGFTNCSTNEASTVSGGFCNSSLGKNSFIGGGTRNFARCCNASIVGGQYNDTCTFCNVVISGSDLCATQNCTTFMNCASIENLTVGCAVIVGANKVLINSPLPVNKGLFAQTSSSTPVTATTAELPLIDGGVGTLSVPENGFNIGDSFVGSMSGIMSAKNNDTLTIRVKSGSVVLADSGALTMPNIVNQVWNLQLVFTVRAIGTAGVASIVTLGELHVLKQAGGSQEGFGFNSINNTTFDTTILNTLSVTAEWSTNSALNSIYTDLFVLNKTY